MVVTAKYRLLICDAMQSSASPVNFCQTAWCYIPEDGILHTLFIVCYYHPCLTPHVGV